MPLFFVERDDLRLSGCICLQFSPSFLNPHHRSHQSRNPKSNRTYEVSCIENPVILINFEGNLKPQYIMSTKQAPLPLLSSLVKPEDLVSLKHHNATSKERYAVGIADLWNKVNKNSPGSVPFNSAVMELADVTKVLQKEHQAAQESHLAATTARRGNVPSRTSQQISGEELNAAFNLMVDAIARSRVLESVTDENLLEKVGGLVFNQAGLLEFKPPRAGVIQQFPIAETTPGLLKTKSRAELEAREDLQSAVALLGQTGAGSLKKEDFQAAVTLLDMKYGDSTASDDTLSDTAIVGDMFSSSPDRSSTPTVRPSTGFTPINGPSKQSQDDASFAQALNDEINPPRRSGRKGTLATPGAYSSKYHPADKVLDPKRAARVLKSMGKK